MSPPSHIPDWVNRGSGGRQTTRQVQIRRRRTAAALGGLALVVVLASVTSPGSGGPHRSSTTVAASTHLAPPPALTEPAAVREQRREGVAVDQLLAQGTTIVQQGGARTRDIALTFDDGPSPYTPALVAQLNRLHVPATFFAVGAQQHYFSQGTRDALQSGYFVEDHTANHLFLTHLDTAGQNNEILGAAQELVQRGAPFPRLFRPPYGSFNRTTLQITRQQKMLSVLWSIDTEDYTLPGTARIIRRVLANAAPGAIVLMHDGGGNRSETVAAVPEIVRGLRAKGYALVSVPRMMLDDPPVAGQGISPGFGGGGGG